MGLYQLWLMLYKAIVAALEPPAPKKKHNKCVLL